MKIGSYASATETSDEIIDRGCSEQGFVFKDSEAYENSLSEVCYIPELSDEKYTRQDFLDITNGQEEFARALFDGVDWQHPETLFDEWEEIVPCPHCGKLYDSEFYSVCPHCGKRIEEDKPTMICSEICPHCEYENEYTHDVEKDGYVVKCKDCGREIFLCDACLHSDDNLMQKCDWENGKCFRGECHIHKD